ncbi:hypothetical protein SNE40_008218 [Patella caerulea]|uniref:Uncharacterized protein n=1 Tax=Patella caerulea TaxID=87958 RepID=A0AAN8QA55_PATCE
MTTQGNKIKLKDLVDITGALSKIICKSFGPRCRQTLLSTSTGKIMITSDGFQILRSLNIGHPVAKVIVEACEKHHSNHGDGVKTFLLYLSTFMQCLVKISLDYENLTLKISRQIPMFIEETLSNCFKTLALKSFFLDSNSKSSDILNHFKSVITTTLSTHFSKTQSQLFSEMIIEAINDHSVDFRDILDLINFYVDYYDLLHIKCRQSYSKSKIIPGILLRDFTVRPHDTSEKNLKFVILQNSIEGNTEEKSDEIIKVSMDTDLDSCFMERIKAAEIFLKKIANNEIRLIFCNQKVPSYVISLCNKYKISVIGNLDDKDIRFLEILTSCPSLSSIYEDITDVSVGETIYERVNYYGKYFINLTFRNPLVKTFLLCAPTDGLVYELSSLFYKTLKTLQTALNGTNNNYPRKLFMREMNPEVEKNGILDSEHLLLENLKVGGNSDQINRLASFETNDTSKKIFLISGGGYFEFQMAKLLKESSKNFTNQHSGMICKILSDVLLCIPEALHTNLCLNIATNKREYIQKLQTILCSDENLCLNRRGEIKDCSSSMPNGCLESLNLKITTLCNVLQLIQQLLRLDMIVGINKT